MGAATEVRWPSPAMLDARRRPDARRRADTRRADTRRADTRNPDTRNVDTRQPGRSLRSRAPDEQIAQHSGS
jgi:hypothetical protein